MAPMSNEARGLLARITSAVIAATHDAAGSPPAMCSNDARRARRRIETMPSLAWTGGMMGELEEAAELIGDLIALCPEGVE